MLFVSSSSYVVFLSCSFTWPSCFALFVSCLVRFNCVVLCSFRLFALFFSFITFVGFVYSQCLCPFAPYVFVRFLYCPFDRLGSSCFVSLFHLSFCVFHLMFLGFRMGRPGLMSFCWSFVFRTFPRLYVVHVRVSFF